MNTFNFKIVSPERVVFESDVAQVSLPTDLGEITVLPNHVPLVSTIIPGEVMIKEANGTEHSLAISSGVVQVRPGAVVLLARTAEMAHEISEDRALEAHRRAQELLQSKSGMPDKDYAALKVLMDKELARLKVARKYKQRGPRPGAIK